MENIFDKETIDRFTSRIERIQQDSQAQWGKMNAYQMLKHCTENDRMLQGKKVYKRLFIGRLFGKIALKVSIKDDQVLKKNGATHPELIIKEKGDVEQQKEEWLSLLRDYPKLQHGVYESFIHPFFGKMKQEEVSRFAYKHIDHHLRQFGV